MSEPINPNIQKLHQNLSSKWPGFAVPLNQFQKDMQDPEKLRRLHENLTKNWQGFKVDYNTFAADMGYSEQPKAPVTTTAVQPENDNGLVELTDEEMVNKTRADRVAQLEPGTYGSDFYKISGKNPDGSDKFGTDDAVLTGIKRGWKGMKSDILKAGAEALEYMDVTGQGYYQDESPEKQALLDKSAEIKENTPPRPENMTRGQEIAMSFGEFVPQMVGIAASIVSAPMTSGTSLTVLPGILSTASMGALVTSSVGGAMSTYEDYMAEQGRETNDAELWAVGLAAGGAEYFAERLGTFKRFLPKGVLSKTVVDWFLKNPQAAGPMFEQFARQQGFKQVLKRYGINTIKQALEEGGEEMVTELGNIIIENLYMDDEHEATWKEMKQRMMAAFEGGAMMGSVLSPMGTWAKSSMARQARERQGYVALAKGDDGKAYEIVGEQPNGKYLGVTPQGKEVELDPEKVEVSRIGLNDYKRFMDMAKQGQQVTSKVVMEAEIQQATNELSRHVATLTYVGEDQFPMLVNGHMENDPEAVVTVRTIDGQTVNVISGSVNNPDPAKPLVVMDKHGNKFQLSMEQVSQVDINAADTMFEEMLAAKEAEIMNRHNSQKAGQGAAENFSPGDQVRFHGAPGTIVDMTDPSQGIQVKLEVDGQEVMVQILPADYGRLQLVEQEQDEQEISPLGTQEAKEQELAAQQAAQQQRTWQVGKEKLPYQQQPDGSAYIPFNGKDHSAAIKKELADDFEMELHEEEETIPDAPEWAKVKTRKVTRGVTIKRKVQPKKAEDEQDVQGQPPAGGEPAAQAEPVSQEGAGQAGQAPVQAQGAEPQEGAAAVESKRADLERRKAWSYENIFEDDNNPGTYIGYYVTGKEDEHGGTERITVYGNSEEEVKNLIRDKYIAESIDLAKDQQAKPAAPAPAKTQAQLEADVEELKAKARALRGPDGTVPQDKVAEFKELNEQISEAIRKATRGDNTGGHLIIKKRGKAENDDPYVLKDESAELAEKAIEHIIKTSKTPQEAIQRITDRYVFSADHQQKLNSYVNDRMTDAPEVGNNKAAFPEWRKGQPKAEAEGPKTAGQKVQQIVKNDEIKQEEAKVNPNPTDGQKEAGNYQKGHVQVQGFDITIENAKGSTRSGVDPSGKAWSVTMKNTYGYFRRTEGADGEQVDTFLGDNPVSDKVYVVDQRNPDGSFDEHKVMLGFNSKAAAAAAYEANYSPGWQGLGAITEMTVDEFRTWVKSADARKAVTYRTPKELAAEKRKQAEEMRAKREALDLHEGPMAEAEAERELQAGEVSEDDLREMTWAQYVARFSRNPLEILKALGLVPRYIPLDMTDPIERAIAANLHHITSKSFERFSDKAFITMAIAKSYFRASGASTVDAVAQAASQSHDGTDDSITPEDVVAFIRQYPNGTASFEKQRNPDYYDLEGRFITITGISPSPILFARAEELINSQQVDINMVDAEYVPDIEALLGMSPEEYQALDLESQLEALDNEDENNVILQDNEHEQEEQAEPQAPSEGDAEPGGEQPEPGVRSEVPGLPEGEPVQQTPVDLFGNPVEQPLTPKQELSKDYEPEVAEKILEHEQLVEQLKTKLNKAEDKLQQFNAEEAKRAAQNQGNIFNADGAPDPSDKLDIKDTPEQRKQIVQAIKDKEREVKQLREELDQAEQRLQGFKDKAKNQQDIETPALTPASQVGTDQDAVAGSGGQEKPKTAGARIKQMTEQSDKEFIDQLLAKGVGMVVKIHGKPIEYRINGERHVLTTSQYEYLQTQQPKQEAEQPNEDGPIETIEQALSAYHERMNYNAFDLWQDVERLGGDNPLLVAAAAKYREEMEYDRSISGRGDMQEAEDNFIKAVEAALTAESSVKTPKSEVNALSAQDSATLAQAKQDVDNLTDEQRKRATLVGAMTEAAKFTYNYTQDTNSPLYQAIFQYYANNLQKPAPAQKEAEKPQYDGGKVVSKIPTPIGYEYKVKYNNGKENLVFYSNNPNLQVPTSFKDEQALQAFRDKLLDDLDNEAGKPEPIPPAPKKPTNYGKDNKVFTEDAKKAAMEALRKKLGNLNAGIDPEVMTLSMQVAGYHIEAGVRKFKDFTLAMVADIGEGIRPYLKSLYEMMRYHPAIDSTDFDAPNIVADIDVNSIKEDQDVSDRDRDSQQGGQNNQDEVPPDAGLVQQERDQAGQMGDAAQGSGGGKNGQAGGKSGSQLFTDLFGEQSTDELHQQDEPGLESPDTGDTDGRGSRTDGIQGGLEFEPDPDEAGSEGDAGLSESFKERTRKRKAQQLKANLIKVVPNDPDNIRRTLPMLLPEQQDDVIKAEKRFFDPSHQTRERAYGKGMLFTNGTGTGKTYTGLGIIARTFRQGKRNILIVVPSQAKVEDWMMDGQNLGLDITALKSTNDPGKGIRITTYANFRANQELLKQDMDLIVYDESHRLMEEKGGNASSTTMTHYSMANVSPEIALDRILDQEPLWIEARQLNTQIRKNNIRVNGNLDMMIEQVLEIEEENKKMDERLQVIKAEQEKLLPGLTERAQKAYANTKVVYLSATPFKAHFNLRYANRTLFDWGDEVTYEQASRTRSRVDPESRFFLDNFSAAYEWKYHRLQARAKANAEAIAMQEVQFAEKLMSQGMMSGRAIESDKDYSREFPLVAMEQSEIINKAFNDIFNYTDNTFKNLRVAAREVFFNYNYTTQLFEALKASMVVPRIKKHLAMGRKIVVFHRRKQANVSPPFASILKKAEDVARMILSDNNSKPEHIEWAHETVHQIALFRNKYEAVLKYEQTLNYGSVIDQLSAAFGSQVVTLNGDTPKGKKGSNIAAFNADNSGVNIIIVQEEAGKEGISLHDITGNHPRVMMSMSLPISSTTALQMEGRIYRIGQETNAIFENPILGLDMEIFDFGNKINRKLSTTENLAVGNQARDLLRSFAEGVLFSSEAKDPHAEQGAGGKEYDAKVAQQLSEFRKAVLVYQSNHKKRGRRDQREGVDYFATPEPIGQKMVEWLQLQAGESGLEPSAGHGAIAMWFPEHASSTVIEPSYQLFSKLGARAGGGSRKLLNETFEDLHVVNKFEGVAMNPPFGVAGKLAMEHVEKAFNHLRDGGRMVALVPRGKMDERLDNFLYGVDEKGNRLNPDAWLIASIDLPSVTFEQAGTSVSCRMVVIDRMQMRSEREIRVQLKAENVRQWMSTRVGSLKSDAELDAEAERIYMAQWENDINDPKRIDLSHIKTVDELFDAMENIDMPARSVASKETPQQAAAAPAQAEQSEGGYEVFEQPHTKTGATLYMASAKEYLGDDYARVNSIAKKHGGYYSSYRNKASNIRAGFSFPSAEMRTMFLAEVDTPGQVGEPEVRFRKQNFYSPTERALQQIKQGTGTVEQFKAMLLKNGAKKAEMEWMDYDGYFTGKRLITKAEIQQWIDQNRVEIKEVVKGGEEIQWVEDTDADGNEVWRSEDGAYEILYNQEDDDYTLMRGNKLITTKGNLESIQNYAQENAVDHNNLKYDSYRIQGGQNYKEWLLTMPRTNYSLPAGYKVITADEYKNKDRWTRPFIVVDEKGVSISGGETKEEALGNYFKYQMSETEKEFKSRHWDEPNVLVHVRTQEFTNDDGERVLLIEELQSDWAQQGRKYGFNRPSTINAYQWDGKTDISNVPGSDLIKPGDWIVTEPGRMDMTYAAADAATKEEVIQLYTQDAADNGDTINSSIPDMPFKQTDQWVALGLRRMMQHAAEQGYDRIAWTGGEMQNERYDLSKQLERIEVYNAGEGEGYRITGYDHEGKGALGEVVTAEKLPDVVGKELTQKIIDSNIPYQETKTFSGLDLQVGGEGMKAFYDKILPAVAAKIIKPFGGKVEQYNLRTNLPYWEEEDLHVTPFGDYEAPEGIDPEGYSEDVYTVQSVAVTPEMGGPQPLFKKQGILAPFVKRAEEHAQIIQAARALGRILGVPIKVVTRRDQLPVAVQARMHSRALYPGVYYDGKIYILASEVRSMAELEATIAHEVVAHKGLREMLGPDFDQTCDRVYNSMSNMDIMFIKEQYETNDPRLVADEYMAQLAETGKIPSWFGRVIAQMRRMLNKLGFKTRMSDADIMYLLWESRRHLMRQRGAASYLNYKAMQQQVESSIRFSKTDEVVRFQIIGKKGAKNLDKYDQRNRLANLEVAKKMFSTGEDYKKIRMATGWERGKDGRWKYEITDLQLKPENNHPLQSVTFQKFYDQFKKDGQAKLGDIVNAPEIFKAYPRLKKMPVTDTRHLPYVDNDNLGSYIPSTKTITLNTNRIIDSSTFESVLTHEVQHAIQQIEGFAKGQSGDLTTYPSEEVMDQVWDLFDMEAIAEIMEDNDIPGDYMEEHPVEWLEQDILPQVTNPADKKRLAEIIANGKEQAKRLMEENTKVYPYLNSAGETEARNAQRRRHNYDNPYYQQKPLRDTEDVPREDQHVRFKTVTPGSAEFTEWFGDSKAVDAQGEPLTLYHGSNKVFDQFNDTDAHYFSTAPELTKQFASRGNEKHALYKVNLALKNPLTIDHAKVKTVNSAYRQRLYDVTKAKSKGHDGVIWNNTIEPDGKGESTRTTVMAVFSPEQVNMLDRQVADDVNDIRFKLIGPKGARRMFRGGYQEAAQTLSIARQMHRQGATVEDIRLQTGWERGIEGKWRYEIDDIQLNKEHKRFKETLEQLKRGEPVLLGNFIKADQLFKAYPDFEVMKLRNDRQMKAAGDLYGDLLRVNDKYYRAEAELLDTLTHELQHAIQHQEGFTTGTNLHNSGLRQLLKREGVSSVGEYNAKMQPIILLKRAEFKRLYNEWERKAFGKRYKGQKAETYQLLLKWQAVEQELKVLENPTYDVNEAYDAYHRTAGEVEARNAATRMGLTPEERRRYPLYMSEDVLRENQILNPFDDQQAESASVKTRHGLVRFRQIDLFDSQGEPAVNPYDNKHAEQYPQLLESSMERLLNEQPHINLVGNSRLRGPEDVAYLFRHLESAATENAFMVHIRADESYVVQQLSMGATDATIIDNKLILAAIDQLKSERVVFVHNHPSGNLKASPGDMQVHTRLQGGMPKGVQLLNSIIINLDSGKFGQFDMVSNTVEDKKDQPSTDIPIKVMAFDKLALYRKTNSANAITSSHGVAEYVSKIKRGVDDKYLIMVAATSNEIVAMYVDSELDADRLAVMAGKHGKTLFIASNTRPDKVKLFEIKQKLERSHIMLLDYLQVDQGADILREYNSMADQGVLEPEGEYGDVRFKQTDSPEFKAWFGDSKVVDEQGQPMVVYHGTFSDFDKFKIAKNDVGIHLGTKGQANDRLKFVSHHKSAKGASIMPVYASISNPLILDIDPGAWDVFNMPFVLRRTGKFSEAEIKNLESYETEMLMLEGEDGEVIGSNSYDELQEMFSNEVVQLIKSKGFDGIKYMNTGEIEGMTELYIESRRKDISSSERTEAFAKRGELEKTKSDYSYVAFEPSQVKSATGNNGQFDPANPDIRFSIKELTQGDDTIHLHNVNQMLYRINRQLGHGKVKAITGSGAQGSYKWKIDQPQLIRFIWNYKQVRNEVQQVLQYKSISDPARERLEQAVTEYTGWIEKLEDALSQNRFSEETAMRFKISPMASGQAMDPKMVNGRYERNRERWQDKQLSVKNLQKTILERGGMIPPIADVYNAENRSQSRSMAQIDYFDNTEWETLETALIRLMDTFGVSLKEINRYLKAKSSIERNDQEQIQALDKDDAGAWGRNNVQQIVDEFEAKVPVDFVEDLWFKVKTCTDFTIKTLYMGGVISRSDYEGMKKRRYYVPLRSWEFSDMENPMDFYAYAQSERTAYQGLIKARGRGSEADDPLAYIKSSAHSAVVSANINQVKQRLLFMARMNEGMDDLLRIKRVWLMQKGTDQYGNPIIVNVIKEGDDAFSIVAYNPDGDPVLQYEGVWDELRDKKIIKAKMDNSHRYRRPAYVASQHEVEVMENGERYIVVAGDPNVALAINGNNIVKPELTRWVQHYIGRINRWLTSNFTAKNPAFIPINWIRDFGYASIAHSVRKDGNLKEFMKAYPEAMASIHRALAGTANPVTNEYDKLYEMFRIHGGETGYVHMREIQDIKVDIERSIRRRTRSNADPRQWLRKSGQLLNYLALQSENSARFATFVASVKAGKSYEQAATDAKNITVNFNRKGRITGLAGALYGFFNATVQGGQNFANMAYENKGRFAVAATSFVVLGAMIGELLRALGDHDEEGRNEYMKLPKWVRQTCLVIPSFDGGFITIPLPPGFRSLYALGVIGSDMAHGDVEVSEGLSDAFTSIVEAFSPITLNDTEIADGQIPARPLIPTPLVPFYDIWVNKDFTGRPIYRVPFTAKQERYQAKSNLSANNVNGLLKALTDSVNRLGGGVDEMSAGFNVDEQGQVDYSGWRDLMYNWNPSKIEHVLEYYLGGRGKFWNDVYKTARQAVDPAEDVQSYNIPVVKRLYRKPYENSGWQEFFELRTEVQDYEHFLKLSENKEEPEMEETMYRNDRMLEISDLYNSYDPELKEINEYLEVAVDPEEIKELREERNQLIKELLQEAKKINDTYK